MSDWSPMYLETDEDRLWYEEGLRRQWWLPEPAGEFWRRPVIRHLRAFCRSWVAYVDLRGDPDFKKLWHAEWLCYAIRRGWL